MSVRVSVLLLSVLQLDYRYHVKDLFQCRDAPEVFDASEAGLEYRYTSLSARSI